MTDTLLIGRGGRRTSPLELVSYHPEWPHIFERERSLIAGILGDDAADSQYIGSTRVSGLAAKPTIDIAVIVNPLLIT